MALPKIQLSEEAERRLKHAAALAATASAALLFVFPLGALTMGLAAVSHVKPGQETRMKGPKRLKSLITDFGELGRHGFAATKSPWVSVPLLVTAGLVAVVPLFAFYVPTVLSTVSYGIGAALIAPKALLVIPAAVHHFRSLKRQQERKLGHPIQAYEVTTGARSISEHAGAEVGDAIALGKWTVGKAVGGVQNVGRLAGWTGKTWKSSWKTSPTVRVGSYVLGSSLHRLGAGGRFVGRAVTLHHIRALKSEVVDLRAKVGVLEGSAAKVEETPVAVVAQPAVVKQRSSRRRQVKKDDNELVA